MLSNTIVPTKSKNPYLVNTSNGYAGRETYVLVAAEGDGFPHRYGFCSWPSFCFGQGLMAYYYDMVRPHTSVELNQCRFNHMGMDGKDNTLGTAK